MYLEYSVFHSFKEVTRVTGDSIVKYRPCLVTPVRKETVRGRLHYETVEVELSLTCIRLFHWSLVLVDTLLNQTYEVKIFVLFLVRQKGDLPYTSDSFSFRRYLSVWGI